MCECHEWHQNGDTLRKALRKEDDFPNCVFPGLHLQSCPIRAPFIGEFLHKAVVSAWMNVLNYHFTLGHVKTKTASSKQRKDLTWNAPSSWAAGERSIFRQNLKLSGKSLHERQNEHFSLPLALPLNNWKCWHLGNQILASGKREGALSMGAVEKLRPGDTGGHSTMLQATRGDIRDLYCVSWTFYVSSIFFLYSLCSLLEFSKVLLKMPVCLSSVEGKQRMGVVSACGPGLSSLILSP